MVDTKRMKFLLLLALVLPVVGCASSQPQPTLPEILLEEFELTIEIVEQGGSQDWEVEIVHHLVNRSQARVCVGGSQELVLAGSLVQKRVLWDGLCFSPLIAVHPGQSVTWTVSWSGTCWPDAPPELLAAIPALACGKELELVSRVWLFRLKGAAPQRGGLEVASRPVAVRLTPREEVSDAVPP